MASECLHASAHHGAIRPLSASLLGLGHCACMQVLTTASSLLSSQVRDLLGLSRAIEGSITVLPKLWCHCDRYWNFLTRCRMPMLQHMELPFGCPMDSLCVLMVTDEP